MEKFIDNVLTPAVVAAVKETITGLPDFLASELNVSRDEAAASIDKFLQQSVASKPAPKRKAAVADDDDAESLAKQYAAKLKRRNPTAVGYMNLTTGRFISQTESNRKNYIFDEDLKAAISVSKQNADEIFKLIKEYASPKKEESPKNDDVKQVTSILDKLKM